MMSPGTSVPVQTFQPPATFVSPASVPVITPQPQMVAPPVTTFRPLVPVAPPPAQYYIGRGLLGQPKLYVPQQPIRNFLRYLSP